jgi:hypothetical protein
MEENKNNNKSNNIIKFHKKDETISVDDVEKDILDDEQKLLELIYEEAVQQNKCFMFSIESVKGQIAYVEKIWKDFNISEFEMKRRKSFYKDLLYGKKMTYLVNKLNVVKDDIERSNILKEILEICVKALEIVDKLYDLDFSHMHTSNNGEIEVPKSM